MNTHHTVNTAHTSTPLHTISKDRMLEFDMNPLATRGDNDILISSTTRSRVSCLEMLVLADLLGL